MATLSVGGTTVFDGATLQAASLTSATFPAGSVVNYHKELYSTRAGLASALVGTFFTFSFDKKNASTDLIVEGYLPSYAEYNGHCMIGFKYGTSAGSYGSMATSFAYQTNSYFSGKLTGHTTTGSQTMSIQWTATSSLYPFSVFCPNVTDNSRLLQSVATVSVFEIM